MWLKPWLSMKKHLGLAALCSMSQAITVSLIPAIAMLHESGDYGELDTGNTALAFSSVALMTSLGKTPGVPDVKAPVFEIAFETDNVQSALDAAINAGATLVQSVKDEPWGQTTAYVTDMNDYLVEICSPVRA